jgi:hypothetical protein
MNDAITYYKRIININYLKQYFLLGQQILNLHGALLEDDQIVMTN